MWCPDCFNPAGNAAVNTVTAVCRRWNSACSSQTNTSWDTIDRPSPLDRLPDIITKNALFLNCRVDYSRVVCWIDPVLDSNPLQILENGTKPLSTTVLRNMERFMETAYSKRALYLLGTRGHRPFIGIYQNQSYIPYIWNEMCKIVTHHHKSNSRTTEHAQTRIFCLCRRKKWTVNLWITWCFNVRI